MSAATKISMGNDILAKSGKRGTLKPIDDVGYYRLRAGGFNIPNRGGVTYRLNNYVKECSRENSEFQRRVSNGQMYCELGHPKQYYLEKIDGQVVRTKITDVFEWIMRLKTIEEQNQIAHIRRVDFEFTGNDNAPVYNDIEIIGHGPWKSIFDESMENPDINTAVSIRTVTKPQAMGDVVREVDYWSTYDVVPEQGMLIACKHLQAGLEGLLSDSMCDGQIIMPKDNHIITNASSLIEICERELANSDTIARYSGNEAFGGLTEMLNVLKENKTYNDLKGKKLEFTGVSGLESFL